MQLRSTNRAQRKITQSIVDVIKSFHCLITSHSLAFLTFSNSITRFNDFIFFPSSLLSAVSSQMSLNNSNYKGYGRAFCVRMKSTLTKRGCHFKSSGYRVSNSLINESIYVLAIDPPARSIMSLDKDDRRDLHNSFG